MAYNDRIVKEIKNTPNLPFLDEKDRQTLIFDKEIRHYLDTIATLIHEEGNRLLLKSHHLQRTVERKWRLLQEDVNKLIDVLDDQLKLVRKKKKDKRLMSKLRKLQKEEKELLKQTIKEDELLATFMSHDVKQYLQDINAFEKEVKKAEKELR